MVVGGQHLTIRLHIEILISGFLFFLRKWNFWQLRVQVPVRGSAEKEPLPLSKGPAGREVVTSGRTPCKTHPCLIMTRLHFSSGHWKGDVCKIEGEPLPQGRSCSWRSGFHLLTFSDLEPGRTAAQQQLCLFCPFRSPFRSLALQPGTERALMKTSGRDHL